LKKNNLFLLKKKQKILIKINKKTGRLFFLKNVFLLNSDYLSIRFVIFPSSHDLEQVTSQSVCLGVRRTLRV